MKEHTGWDRIENDLHRALSCPVDRLVAEERRALPADAAQDWDIPEGDRIALRSWGLPPQQLFTATPQPGNDPVLMAHPARDDEGLLTNGRDRLYKLGYWGPSEGSGLVGVIPGEGRALYLLFAPIIDHDLPEVLRTYHAGLYKPAVSILSSSLTQYIETAWRWHAASKVIERAEEPEAPASEAEVSDHYARLYGLVDLILDAARRIDPAAATGDPPSIWIELIRENSL